MYAYLTTTGRKSGRPHTIEIWFGQRGSTIYMLAGGRERADWVRNLMKTPEVLVRIDATTYRGTARAVEPGTEEDAAARQMLVEKYAPGYSSDLTRWGETALPIAIDITGTVTDDQDEAR